MNQSWAKRILQATLPAAWRLQMSESRKSRLRGFNFSKFSWEACPQTLLGEWRRRRHAMWAEGPHKIWTPTFKILAKRLCVKSPSATFANMCSWLVTHGNFYTKQFSISSLVRTFQKLPFCDFFPQITQTPGNTTQLFHGTAQNLSQRGLALPVIWHAAPAHTSRHTHKNRMSICSP